MRRSNPPRKNHRKHAPIPPPRGVFSSSVDLVLVDASPRRQQEKDRYGERCREVEDLGDRLKAFEEREMPAFAAWIDREFEREISRLRQEQALVRELQELAVDVERYAAWTGVSFGVALDRIRRAKAEGTEAELWREAAGGDDDQDATDEDADTEEADEEAFSRRFAEAFADAEGESETRGRAGATRHAPPPTEAERTSELYLKTLYRQLVRALHPDSNPDQDDQALWQQVQDAYSWGDVARLERLRKVVLKTGDRSLNLDHAPIGDIINLRKTVEGRLRKLRTSLRQAKGHPAWDFLKARATAARLRQLRRELGAAMADDLITMQQERRQLEMWIASFRQSKREAPRQAQRSKQGRAKDRGY